LSEKGGPRDDEFFPVLSPVWPGSRPANAFAGLTRGLSQNRSWSALRGYAALRALAIALVLAPASWSTAAIWQRHTTMAACPGCRDRRQDL